MTIQIGPWVQGEKPEDLVYQFKARNAAGEEVVVPLPTGWEGRFVIKKGSAAAVERVAVVDHTENTVTYTPQPDDMDTPGGMSGQFWAGNGSRRLASEDYEWDVERAVGGIVPNI